MVIGDALPLALYMNLATVFIGYLDILVDILVEVSRAHHTNDIQKNYK